MTGSTEEMPALDLAEAIETRSLAAARFRHREHVQLGWYYLTTLPLLDAVTRFGRVVAAFASHHGAHDKYDESLTVAYMLLIEERRQRMPDADWPTFVAGNADLLTDGRAVLLRRLAHAGRGPVARDRYL